jgi:uncharacterized protein YheU (UPF0270 family)
MLKSLKDKNYAYNNRPTLCQRSTKMIIPVSELPEQTLIAIAEDFVTREGTDYGEIEHTLQQKVEQLIGQIKAGEVLISFESASESINLISKQNYIESIQEAGGEPDEQGEPL